MGARSLLVATQSGDDDVSPTRRNPTLNAYGYDPVWRPYGGEGSASPSRAFMALERQQMRAPSAATHSSGTAFDLGRRIALWNSFLPRLAGALAAHEGPGGPKTHEGSAEDQGEQSSEVRRSELNVPRRRRPCSVKFSRSAKVKGTWQF
jgi:hypothetical protein